MGLFFSCIIFEIIKNCLSIEELAQKQWHRDNPTHITSTVFPIRSSSNGQARGPVGVFACTDGLSFSRQGKGSRLNFQMILRII